MCSDFRQQILVGGVQKEIQELKTFYVHSVSVHRKLLFQCQLHHL